jgi:ADP-ribose pyrophosphatase YjhB (NUDIX family)
VLESHEPGKEFLVRACGILIHGEAVLVQEAARPNGPALALPGGHLEFGETLAACMAREFYEESRLNVEAEKLVYVHENFYTLKGVRTHELGFYFLVDLNSAFPTPDSHGYIPSREPHLRFRLVPLARLQASFLMPGFLRDQLPRDAADRFAHPTRHLVSREG